MRLSELTIHLADLDRGYDLDRVLGLLGPLTEDIVQHAITSRSAHLPALRLVGDGFEWTMGAAPGETVSGSCGALLAWLSGRSDGSALDGDVRGSPPGPERRAARRRVDRGPVEVLAGGPRT